MGPVLADAELLLQGGDDYSQLPLSARSGEGAQLLEGAAQHLAELGHMSAHKFQGIYVCRSKRK